MKLSIITPIYKEAKRLDRFLSKISTQNSNNYELILIIDTNGEKTLEVVEKYREKINGDLRIIFNSKRNSRFKSIGQGAKIAKGKYSIVLSIRNEFSSSLVKNVIALAEEKGTDIIEFSAAFNSPIKLKGKIRKQFKTSSKIEDNPEIIAWTYPFDFNKIYKTSVLSEVGRVKMPVNFNSRYSIGITYFSLSVAKTYSTSLKTLVKSRVNNSSQFNYIHFVRHFDAVVDLISKSPKFESIDRYLYAQYFTEVVFAAPFVKSSKNKASLKKFKDKIQKRQETKFINILDVNQYAILMPKEKSVLLSHISPGSMYKAYKELEK
ncbi:MAG: glycosyltransferase [Mycoplasmatales bacterium]|nr:glycosyltransferase [Mycoplasmatales bacterium]